MRKTPVSGFPKALFFPGSHAQKSSGVEIGQNVTVQPCVKLTVASFMENTRTRNLVIR